MKKLPKSFDEIDGHLHLDHLDRKVRSDWPFYIFVSAATVGAIYIALMILYSYMRI